MLVDLGLEALHSFVKVYFQASGNTVTALVDHVDFDMHDDGLMLNRCHAAPYRTVSTSSILFYPLIRASALC